MATIIRRDGKKGVTYKIQVAVKDAGLGKMVTKSTTWKPEKGMTEKEIDTACTVFAEDFERQVINSFKTAEEDKGNVNITFKALSEKWIARAVKLYGVSYEGNASQSLEVVLPLIGGYKVKDITASIVQSVFDKIDTAKKISDCLSMDMNDIFDVVQRNVPYKSNYIEGMRKVVRITLSTAARQGIIKRNYAHRMYVTCRHSDADKVKSMTFEEAKRLLQICEQLDIRKKTIITFIMFTGVRKGEICGLNWSDIDFDNKKVRIVRQYEAVAKKGLILKEPKTEAGKRELELSNHLITVLEDYRNWYEEKRSAMGDKWQGEDYFLVAQNGNRLHPTQIRNWLDEALELAGLPHYSVHSLRHTNITLLIASGVSPVTVAGRVGHKKASTTMNIYADFLGSSDREASEKINDYFVNTPAKAESV